MPNAARKLPAKNWTEAPVAHITLDASALLAVIHLAPGGNIVTQHRDTTLCSMSAVNLSEVAAKLAEGGADADDLHAVLEPFSLDVRALDEDRAINAALLRPPTRAAGLSFGGRA